VPVRLLSLGQRVRADIAAAMVHGPQLLYLDEPTIGLDVVAKDRIRGFLRQINREHGTTIILTTHDLRDIEATCGRVVMIHHGRLTFDGGIDQLRGTFGDICTLVVTVAAPTGQTAERGPLDATALSGMADTLPPGLRLTGADSDHLTFEFDRAVLPATTAINAVCAVLPVLDVSLQETDLESVVRRVYGEVAS
jgi:ABC-2 type transport system ATP-binding protein